MAAILASLGLSAALPLITKALGLGGGIQQKSGGSLRYVFSFLYIFIKIVTLYIKKLYVVKKSRSSFFYRGDVKNKFNRLIDSGASKTRATFKKGKTAVGKRMVSMGKKLGGNIRQGNAKYAYGGGIEGEDGNGRSDNRTPRTGRTGKGGGKRDGGGRKRNSGGGGKRSGQRRSGSGGNSSGRRR